MIPRTPSGDTFKTKGGGSSSASRLRDKRSSRIAVAVAAMLSLVLTTFAGTATAFASPEDPSVKGFEDQFNPDTTGDRTLETDPPSNGGDAPTTDQGAGTDDPSQDEPAGGISLFSDDGDDSSGINPFAAGDDYYPSDAPGVIYSSTANGQVHQVTYDAATGNYAQADFGSMAPNVSSFNGLGISPGPGREMYAYERSGSNPAVSSATVFTFNQQTGAWTNTGVAVNSKNTGMGGAIQFIGGAVDPAGNFYMGGYSTDGNAYRIYKYVPGSTAVTYVGYVDTSSIAGGTNGDMDFDKLGNLYITRCCGTSGTTVISVSAAALASPGSNNRITATIAQTVGGSQMPAVTGVTFDSSGHMFLGSSTDLRVYNMPAVNNEVVARGSALNSSDLASAASPPIINLQKNVDGKRFEDTDQFTLALESKISETAWQLIADKTTTGTAEGIQAEHVGPFPVTVGTQLKVREAAAGTTDFDNYKTSLECVNGQGGPVGVEASGGAEGIFNYPAGVTSVTCTFTNKGLHPDLEASKTADPASGSNVTVGDTIEYTLTFDNEDGTGAADVDYTDALAQVLTNADLVGSFIFDEGLEAVFEGDLLKVTGSVPAGEVLTVTFEVKVTKAGGNNALVNYLVPGTEDPQIPTGPEDCDEEDGCHFTEHFLPELKVSKSSDPASGTGVAVGNEVTYTLTFDNTAGKAPAEVEYTDVLTDVWSGATLVSDSLAADPELAAQWTVIDDLEVSGTVAPGATSTVSFKVKVSPENEGKIVNFLVPGHNNPEPPEECEVDDPLCTENPIPALELKKYATKKVLVDGEIKYLPFIANDFEAGNTITYLFQVSNVGGVILNDIQVNETEFSGSGSIPAVSCPTTPLPVGESMQCTADYVITEGDVEAGVIDNAATATGNPPSGPPPVSPPADAQAPAANITLVKTADKEQFEVGEEVTYTFTVTNDGEVDLTDVKVNEVSFNGDGELSAVDCPATKLAVGESMECTATYTPTPADVDRGWLNNVADAEGTPPGDPNDPDRPGEPVKSPPDEVKIPGPEHDPGLEILKTADTDEFQVGEEITYTFEVTNTGNVTLTDVSVNEVSFNGDGELSAVECPATKLAAGEAMECTATYVPTQADMDRGEITNAATAVGTPPADPSDPDEPGEPMETPPSTVEVPGLQDPALDLVKTADKQKVTKAGEVIAYTFKVSNTGNVTLTNVKVEDTKFSGKGTLPEPTCGQTTLAPGESTVCTTKYTVVEEDLKAKEITNIAVATGETPSDPNNPDKPGTPVKSDPDEAKVQVDPPVVPGKPNLPKTGAAVGLGLLGVAALGAGSALRRKGRGGAHVA